MEEIKKQLFTLQNLTYELDYINGLLYILREALRENEDMMGIHYMMASAYISNLSMEFEEKLDTLMDDMFHSFHVWGKELQTVVGEPLG